MASASTSVASAASASDVLPGGRHVRLHPGAPVDQDRGGRHDEGEYRERRRSRVALLDGLGVAGHPGDVVRAAAGRAEHDARGDLRGSRCWDRRRPGRGAPTLLTSVDGLRTRSRRTGQTWVTTEAVAVAIWCQLAGPSARTRSMDPVRLLGPLFPTCQSNKSQHNFERMNNSGCCGPPLTVARIRACGATALRDQSSWGPAKGTRRLVGGVGVGRPRHALAGTCRCRTVAGGTMTRPATARDLQQVVHSGLALPLSLTNNEKLKHRAKRHATTRRSRPRGGEVDSTAVRVWPVGHALTPGHVVGSAP